MKKSLLSDISIDVIIIGILISISGCEKEKDDPQYSITKADPIIFNPSITYGSLIDQEGNIYKTVTIGTQTWMAENLRTTKYNDGTSIPFVSSWKDWAHLDAPGYCWYNNNPTICKSIYGALYNWHAAHTGKLAPDGWHVPSRDEWKILIDFLGGDDSTSWYKDSAGRKLKEADTTHWAAFEYPPYYVGTNESGFTALPGGQRWAAIGDYEQYNQMGYYAFFWCFDADSNNWGMVAAISYQFNQASVGIEQIINKGFSVRCVKDADTSLKNIPNVTPNKKVSKLTK